MRWLCASALNTAMSFAMVLAIFAFFAPLRFFSAMSLCLRGSIVSNAAQPYPSKSRIIPMGDLCSSATSEQNAAKIETSHDTRERLIWRLE